MIFNIFAVGATILAAGLIAYVVVDIARDEPGVQPAKVTKQLAEFARLTAKLAPIRTIDEIAADVEPKPIEDWPQRQTPSDLDAVTEQPRPSILDRVRPMAAELALREAQERAIAAAWSTGHYRPRHARNGETTQQFDRIVESAWEVAA